MSAPVIRLPHQFDGLTLSKVVADLVASSPNKLPEKLVFDFSALTFVRPAGVVFLSNLIHWLGEKGTAVSFVHIERERAALFFLDDSLFFEQHCGSKVRPNAAPRATTRPLIRIAQNDAHHWLETNLLPWLAHRMQITEASLYSLKVCVSELFNNIRDHTRYDIGSIFVQHFPRENRVVVSVSDFGIGIPENVRKNLPALSDAEAIVQAVQEGFTTKSTPANRGAGLDYLARVVVLTNGGTLTVHSLGAL